MQHPLSDSESLAVPLSEIVFNPSHNVPIIVQGCERRVSGAARHVRPGDQLLGGMAWRKGAARDSKAAVMDDFVAALEKH